MPDKVDAITNLKFTSTILVLRGFLGTIHFYRKFVKNAAEILAPLNKLLEGPKVKNTTPIIETPELLQAFNDAKRALADATLLAHPVIDAPWAIFSDASNTAIEAVLQQQVQGKWQPLAFFSKKLQPSIQKLSTYDRELHAVYEAVRNFRHIFEGELVAIYTDHKPLLHAFQQRTERASPWQFRRLDFIGQFSSDFRHIAGSENIVADTLSHVEAIATPISTHELVNTQQEDPDSRIS